MVSLRQLRYLESLAETRHFGQAAEACAVSQPALSMQIKELEDELRVSLVERRKSGIELTEQGEEVARRARAILASVRDLLDYAKHQEGVLSGVLKLGAIPSIAPYLLPAALPELQRRFPGLNLQLRKTVTSKLVRELVSGDLDLILIALPIEEPESRRSICSTTGSSWPPKRRNEIGGSAMRAPRCLRILGCSCSRRAIACATKRFPIAIW
jgi:LysR family hydrogen peroxide-inducible transcriptional activator